MSGHLGNGFARLEPVGRDLRWSHRRRPQRGVPPALGATTIYFLNGSRMMQVSSPYTAAPPVVKQTGMTAPAFASGTSPSASGGWATDGNAGTHNVLGRVGAGIYLGVANSDSLIGP